MINPTLKRHEQLTISENDFHDAGVDAIVTLIKNELNNQLQSGPFKVIVESISIRIGNHPEIPYKDESNFRALCANLS